MGKCIGPYGHATSKSTGECSWCSNPVWLPNMQSKKQHLAVYGWSSTGTGIVAACDKKGIFLIEGPTTDLPRCKSCAAREEKS